MDKTESRANLAPVSDNTGDESRGAAIKRRRLHHGIKSIRELADKSGISRDALTAAEKDEASDATYERVEAWFDRFDFEVGESDEPGDDEYVQFQITGLYGVREIVVKGPVGSLAELEGAVERLVRGAQAQAGDDSPS